MPLAIAGVVAVVAAGVLVFRAVVAGADGCSGGVKLAVAAAPDVEPVVRAAAVRWTKTAPKVNDECVEVTVRAAEPAAVAALLASRAGGTINLAADPVPIPSDAQVPAVWIPDSTSWILRLQAVNKDTFDPGAPSVALSPVVFAMPTPLARTFQAQGKERIGPAELPALLQKVGSGAVTLGAVEPRRSSTGLAGATVLHDAIVTDPKKLVDMVKAYRAVDVAPDTATLLKSLPANRITPLSEQAVLAFDASSPPVPLTAVPIDPAAALDYPYATVAGRPQAVRQAADQFRAALSSPANQDLFARAGFRAPDGSTGSGFPAGNGATGLPVSAKPLTDPQKITDVLGYWIATTSPSRILSLIDVTASMNRPMTGRGAGISRLDVLRKTATEGLGLFTDDSELGLWAYAANLGGGKDYREVVPVGVLNQAQRAKLAGEVGRAAAASTDVCGLYETVLAAYKTLKDGYREGRSNTVVVFTDGGNSKPGMSLETFKLELERVTDPTRPVRVVLLGVGPDIDTRELEEIAATSGGRAFTVQDPDQIGNIFLQALLRSGG